MPCLVQLFNNNSFARGAILRHTESTRRAVGERRCSSGSQQLEGLQLLHGYRRHHGPVLWHVSGGARRARIFFWQRFFDHYVFSAPTNPWFLSCWWLKKCIDDMGIALELLDEGGRRSPRDTVPCDAAPVIGRAQLNAIRARQGFLGYRQRWN